MNLSVSINVKATPRLFTRQRCTEATSYCTDRQTLRHRTYSHWAAMSPGRTRDAQRWQEAAAAAVAVD